MISPIAMEIVRRINALSEMSGPSMAKAPSSAKRFARRAVRR